MHVTEARGLRALTIMMLTLATVTMLALSMLTNATFGYRFGTTAMTAAVFAAANVIADIWKGLGLIVIAGLLRERHRTIAVSLILLWIVALSFGVASSMGVYGATARCCGNPLSFARPRASTGRKQIQQCRERDPQSSPASRTPPRSPLRF